ncbi:MAG: hypothetical protein M1826_006085 [Phylliscum demangeonii]|nr:MAG: hypothetical protein M1826_006085 [Phylliscum demangeonii]
MTLGIAPPRGHMNGSSTANGEAEHGEMEEYKKIIRLHDDVLAGKHPRLKVPAQLASKLPPRPPPSSLPPRPAAARTDLQALTPLVPLDGPSGLPATEPPSSKSAIAPDKDVVLQVNLAQPTSPEDLLKAELRLKRDRIEHILRESSNPKQKESQTRFHLSDAVPDFNVSKVLTDAMAKVKPVPATRRRSSNPKADSTADASIHSRLPVKTPAGTRTGAETTDLRPSQPSERNENPAVKAPLDLPDVIMSDAGPANIATQRQELQTVDKTHLPRPDFPDEKRAEFAQAKDAFSQSPALLPKASAPTVQEEAANGHEGNVDYAGHNVAQPEQVDLRQTDERVQNGSDAEHARRVIPASSSSTPDFPVIRSEIRSPLAPQPARVSPLTFARLPPAAFETSNQTEAGVGQLAYPDPNAPDAETGYPQVQPNDDRERRMIEDGYRIPDIVHDHALHQDSVDRSRKHRADLHRYANIQLARPLGSPSPYATYPRTETRPIRAPSQSYVERGPPDIIHYYRNEVGPYHSPYIRSERSRSPRPVQEFYSPPSHRAVVMAPPSHMQVPTYSIDEQGRRYIDGPPTAIYRHAVVPAGSHTMVAGPRHREPELYYERVPVPMRMSEHLYGSSHRYMGHPAPSAGPAGPTMRRFSDQVEHPEYRTYRTREYSTRPDDGGLLAREQHLYAREISDRGGPPAREQYQEVVVPRHHEYIQRFASIGPESEVRYEIAAPPPFHERPQQPQPQPPAPQLPPPPPQSHDEARLHYRSVHSAGPSDDALGPAHRAFGYHAAAAGAGRPPPPPPAPAPAPAPASASAAHPLASDLMPPAHYPANAAPASSTNTFSTPTETMTRATPLRDYPHPSLFGNRTSGVEEEYLSSAPAERYTYMPELAPPALDRRYVDEIRYMERPPPSRQMSHTALPPPLPPPPAAAPQPPAYAVEGLRRTSYRY